MKLNAAKQREVCAILTVGGTRRVAAYYVGCHVDTIRRTALRLPEFAEQLRKAEAGPEVTFLRNLQTAAQDVRQWRAAAWALERMFPERYGRRSPTAITQEEMTDIVEALGAIVLAEVPAKPYRQRVLARLAELSKQRTSEKQKTLPHDSN